MSIHFASWKRCADHLAPNKSSRDRRHGAWCLADHDAPIFENQRRMMNEVESLSPAMSSFHRPTGAEVLSAARQGALDAARSSTNQRWNGGAWWKLHGSMWPVWDCLQMWSVENPPKIWVDEHRSKPMPSRTAASSKLEGRMLNFKSSVAWIAWPATYYV